MKKTRRLLAFLLSAVILMGQLFSDAQPLFAADTSEEELKASLAAMETDSPNGTFGFYKTELSGDEGSRSVITIVRMGNTTTGASVSLKAVDVSARYGEDYLLYVKKGIVNRVLEGNANTQTLMDIYSQGNGSLPVNYKEDEVSAEAVTVTDAAVAVTGETVTVSKEAVTSPGNEEYTEVSVAITPSAVKTGSSLKDAYYVGTGKVSDRKGWEEIYEGSEEYNQLQDAMDTNREAMDSFAENT